MSTIAIVPARGGSKGLKDKNLATLSGRTLVAIAVETARAVPAVDEVVVSSDDERILDEARRCGATAHVRPAELAGDDVPTAAVVDHLLGERPEASVVVLLQPTSPLRTPADVEACLAALAGAPAAVTVAPAPHPPGWLFGVEEGRLVPVTGWDDVPTRRQDAGPVYTLNGAVYAATADHLRAGGAFVGPGTAAVVMPPERSVDVDGAVDLELARLLAGGDGP